MCRSSPHGRIYPGLGHVATALACQLTSGTDSGRAVTRAASADTAAPTASPKLLSGGGGPAAAFGLLGPPVAAEVAAAAGEAGPEVGPGAVLEVGTEAGSASGHPVMFSDTTPSASSPRVCTLQ